MRIAIIGADHMTQRNVLREARGRGHAVTVFDSEPTSVAAITGHDVVIAATSAGDAGDDAAPRATVYRVGSHPVGMDYAPSGDRRVPPAAYAAALLDAVEGGRRSRRDATVFSRRALLRASLALPVPALLAACDGGQVGSAVLFQNPTAASSGTPVSAASAVVAVPTPACGDDDDDDLTVAQTEGPYYTPRPPERASLLEPGMSGTRLLVAGYVLSTTCQPVARALVDFWQADDAGVYDNTGYRLRGYQFTDDAGRYTLETVVPGLYPGRTRHIHVKVQPPNGAVLTTQVYFPNEPRNARDGIYSPALVMAMQDTADGKLATFNYVVNTP